MDAKPTYGYLPCVFRGCNNQVPMYLDPADFSLHPKCRPCKIMRRTHLKEPFCNHGHIITDVWEEMKRPPCGCTYESAMQDATWDWVSRDILLRDSPPLPRTP